MEVWSVRSVCTDGSPGSLHSASSHSQARFSGCSHDTLVETFLLPGSEPPRAWRWTKPPSTSPPSPPSQAYCGREGRGGCIHEPPMNVR